MKKLDGTLVLLVAVLGICAAAAGQAQEDDPSPGFGTKDRIQSHIGYSEFSPISSATTYDNFDYPGQGSGRYSTVPFGTFVAHPHVPTGAVLVSLELDYCDFSATQHVSIGLSFCSFLGDPCSSVGVLSSSTGPTGCSFQTVDLSSLAFTMQNNVGQLQMLGATESGGPSNLLVGAYIGYKLQVSPAPATATFSDVPTTSPQFKFVEALVAAGITAGCGGGNYCPNQPVTRGQMAVFLASALGLQWPN